MSKPPSIQHARHLRALRWGHLDGPVHYADLPEDLRDIARTVDEIGDDLAHLRVALLPQDGPQRDPVVQVNIVAHALAHRVQAPSGPDPRAVWTRAELDPTFDPRALDGALAFLAAGGEPNVFRSGGCGRPALKDVRALQLVCQDLLDLCADAYGWDTLSPSSCLEDFVRMHGAPAGEGDVLSPGWEEHPLGMTCFAAVRAVRHLPDEPAELPDGPREQTGPYREGRGWEPPSGLSR